VSYPGGPPPSYAVNVQTDAKDHNIGSIMAPDPLTTPTWESTP
jgi:hypothetical protein